VEIVAGLLRHPSPISIDASDRVRLSLTYSREDSRQLVASVLGMQTHLSGLSGCY
jgi:hypothetical protein